MGEPTAEALLRNLETPKPELKSTDAERIVLEHFGIDATARSLGGERDSNFHLQTAQGGLLLKVANQADSEALVDFQCKALQHIRSTDPSLPIPQVHRSLDGRPWVVVTGAYGHSYNVRLHSYLPGQELRHAADDQRLMRGVGALVARLGQALRGFFHPAADHPLAWDMKRAGTLAHLAARIEVSEIRALVTGVFDEFQARVLPVLPRLRAQVIHNDVSFHNCVVNPERPWEISGVYDFGDLIHAPLVQDLAVTVPEVAAGRSDPMAAMAEIAAGYHSVTPLEPKEIALLPLLASTRLAMGLAIESWKPTPDERDHYEQFADNSWALLEDIYADGLTSTEQLFRAACGLTTLHPGVTPRATNIQALRERRAGRLGAGLELSYDRPLHAVRGEGVWLFDPAGNACLDAYNNVPQVGHCHPRVVAAIARQAALLNTNTRYLYEAIVEFGDRLTATLPGELEVCMLVSSGSEANDLAWRISKTCTGNTGALVLQGAYHGITDATHDLSPYNVVDRADLAAHVETIDPPDDYRGAWGRADAERGPRYAGYTDAALERLGAKGHRPALFMIDTVMSSSGIFEVAPGYLSGVFKRVRALGGLCVADEVQAGFGRTGKHMWGFEQDDVIPDIVTLGKPIGNGHPIGAVVTRRELADEFYRATGFFSTTGGNPVSCAAATAVLDVIEREQLQKNALQMGNELARGIEALAQRYPVIGDVRGPGLFIGVELVRDPATREPAPAETRAVVNGMRDRGVLIGRDGLADNVLKIRPPIVFQSSHVDRLLTALDETLKEVEVSE
jgi:4-aminobutyrate aminotransferase-like enzyme/Ser/Thr protein kinase RdoA (MazF antagonist)